MAYTTPTTHVAGETLPAADYNVIVNDIIDHESRLAPLAPPRGIQVYTTSSSNTVTSNILTGLNTTFTFVAGRTYKLSANVVVNCASSGRVIGNIFIAGYTSNTRELDFTAVGGGGYMQWTQYTLIATPGAGSKAITLGFQTISGSFTMAAAAGNLHWLSIEDIGAL